MNDDDLKSLFQASQPPAPSEEARARARRAALAAFAAAGEPGENNTESAQGNVTSLRPTTDNNPSVRRRTMKTMNQRWIASGVASAAVLVVTVSVLLNLTNPEVESEHSVSQDAPEGMRQEIVVTARKNEASEPPAPQPQAPAEALSAERQRADVGLAADAVSQVDMPESLGQSRALAHLAPAPGQDESAPSGYYRDKGRDEFEDIESNPVKLVADEPVSTFSVDVDTASYSFVRRQLNHGVLPQKDAVRVEELINYFDYEYPLPENREAPFEPTVTVTDAPWKAGNKLIHIGIRGYDIDPGQVPASNLVFLLDVSGSMAAPDKLPLVKQSMGMLLSRLKPTDTVSIVAYAGAAGTVLEPTPAAEKQKILSALDRLQAGGSTAGGQGIELAYGLAKTSFDEKAINRVILATDGDFNVGISDRSELQGFVERQREQGIYLSVLGFGQGNYNDHLMQVLAQNGNGTAAYIDTLGEAQKVLVDQATSTLFPIAKDVKIQMEFNPATVAEYRLLGYETRALKREDFNNDKVDAGDIGAGHRVTAIYEITPVGADSGLIEPSRYDAIEAADESHGDEYGFLKIRYKLPDESTSRLITTPVTRANRVAADDGILARETGFATAVAGFAQLLRGGTYTGEWTYQDVIELAQRTKGEDPYGYRTEFVQLARKAAVAEGM